MSSGLCFVVSGNARVDDGSLIFVLPLNFLPNCLHNCPNNSSTLCFVALCPIYK